MGKKEKPQGRRMKLRLVGRRARPISFPKKPSNRSMIDAYWTTLEDLIAWYPSSRSILFAFLITVLLSDILLSSALEEGGGGSLLGC